MRDVFDDKGIGVQAKENECESRSNMNELYNYANLQEKKNTIRCLLQNT